LEVTVVDSSPASSYRAGPDRSHRIDTTSAWICGLRETGFDSAESCLAVASDGTLFFAPAFTAEGNGVLVSRDAGRSWSPRIPPHPGRHGRAQPFLYLEPGTERLFFMTTAMSARGLGRGFHLSYTDDHGETWRHNTVAHGTRDWAKLYGDGRVLYLSAPAPISTRVFPVLFPRRQEFLRSYDRGSSWQNAGTISLWPRAHGLDPREWVIFGDGVVAADGTVLVGLRRGPNLAVAISSDEGAGWRLRDVPGARLLRYRNLLQVGLVNPNYVIGQPLALGADGTLYALWPDEHDRLRMAYSRDLAETWSEPVVVSAPEVQRIRYGAITTAPDTGIAIAYYGTADGTTYHGYLAQSTDSCSAAPTFVGGPVDDPARPLYPRGWDTGYIDMLAGGDLNEIVQVRYAPDGTVYASFCRQQRPGWPRSPRPRAHLTGVLGVLSPAPQTHELRRA
jgi:hypothetical protein